MKNKKIQVKINDNIVLWNGEKGKVIATNLSTYEVSIGSVHGSMTTCHKMNIRFVNEKEVYAQNLFF